MVTASLNHEQRPHSSGNNEDAENDNRSIQTRLDRLYLENTHHSHSSHQYPQRTHSPSNSREIHMSLNTVPVYRHGRKFYVSAEEFERMRAEERRHRRALLKKSQNLPVSKSHQTNVRLPSSSLYNPIHRSTSHPHEHRYGVLRSPHLQTNPVMHNSHNPHESTRQSRSTLRYYDVHADVSTMKLPTTSSRSNSSDKVLGARRTPQPFTLSYNGYTPDDYELKRSFSAEIVQPPQVLPRRAIHTPTCDFSMSTSSSSAFPLTNADQTYNQPNTSKPTSCINRIQSSMATSPMKLAASDFPEANSMYGSDTADFHQTYSVRASSTRNTRIGLSSVLPRSSSDNSNNEYYLQDATSGSLSDDNSSSPSMLMQRPHSDSNHYRRNQLIVETDDDYESQGQWWTRSTARSNSSDRLTEKKRVRFADMEGFTLETVPDVERPRLQIDNRSLTKQLSIPLTNDLRGQEQHFQNSYYQMTTRVGDGGSKLATDV